MQVQLETLGALERRLNITLPMADIDAQVAQRLQRVARTAKVQGFRPGKAPLKIVEQNYGAQVREDVLGEEVQKSFAKAIQEQKIDIAGYPRFEPFDNQTATGESFTFSAVFEVYPEVAVGDLSGQEIAKATCDVTEAESTLNAKMFQLRSFLGVSESEGLNPVIPASVPGIKMDYDRVLNKALERNSFAQNIRRRQLEADYEVATARGNLRSIDLFASVGYTGQNYEFSSAYQDLLDNQIVKVGVKIPILDWGKRRGKVRVAKSNREVVLSKIRQEQMDFNQDIFLLVANFNNQAQQLEIAEEADQIAEKRYKTSVETFMIGKISTLDLNDAQNSKDEARQKHISELYYYWYYFYQLRSLTLWDFERNMELEADFEDIIKG